MLLTRLHHTPDERLLHARKTRSTEKLMIVRRLIFHTNTLFVLMGLTELTADTRCNQEDHVHTHAHAHHRYPIQ